MHFSRSQVGAKSRKGTQEVWTIEQAQHYVSRLNTVLHPIDIKHLENDAELVVKAAVAACQKV